MYGLIRKNLCLWGYGKAAALFLGCLIFSISGRLDHGISYEQHILSAVSDHYYLTYFMLPILLLSCFSFLEDDGIPVAVLMKFLDIYLQYLFMLCIYLFTKQVSVSFLILAAGNLLCVLPGALASCLPFGLSGLMRISLMHSGIGISAVTAFGILVSFSLLLTVWLAVFGCRKILD